MHFHTEQAWQPLQAPAVTLLVIGRQVEVKTGVTATGKEGMRAEACGVFSGQVLRRSVHRRKGASQPLDIVSGESTKEFGSS